jgi:hypothetical protein
VEFRREYHLKMEKDFEPVGFSSDASNLSFFDRRFWTYARSGPGLYQTIWFVVTCACYGVVFGSEETQLVWRIAAGIIGLIGTIWVVGTAVFYALERAIAIVTDKDPGWNHPLREPPSGLISLYGTGHSLFFISMAALAPCLWYGGKNLGLLGIAAAIVAVPMAFLGIFSIGPLLYGAFVAVFVPSIWVGITLVKMLPEENDLRLRLTGWMEEMEDRRPADKVA